MPADDPAEPCQLHVALASPARIKLENRSVVFVAFDAAVAEDQDGSGFVVFDIDRIYCADRSVSVKVSFMCPLSNISGMVEQPFVER